MARSRSRIWVPVLAALLVVALVALDYATGEDVIIVPLYVLGPLLASLVASRGATAALGGFGAAAAKFGAEDRPGFDERRPLA